MASPIIRRAAASALLWLPAALFLGFFFILPAGAVLREGVSAAWEAGGVAYEGARLARVASFTVLQAVLSTALTFSVGMPGAYLLARYEFPGRRLLRALLMVPFVLPTVVAGAGFQALLGPRGILPAVVTALGGTPPEGWIPSFGALLMAHVFYNTSIVLRVVGDAWSRMDPRLTDAARVLGAGRAAAFRQVTLPLLAPALLAAASLVFLFDFTSFGAVLLLAGPRYVTLEVETYNQAVRMLNLPAAAVLSATQAACTLALGAISSVLSRRNEDALRQRPVVRAAFRPRTLRQWAAVLGGAVVLGALLLAPLAAPVLRSVWSPASNTPMLTYYHELFQNRRGSAFFISPAQAAGNSINTAAAATGLALLLGLPAAVAFSRSDVRWPWVETIFLLPLGFSSVTLGLGVLLVFSRPPLDILTQPWLLPTAHAVIALPFVVRSLRPALAGIPRRWREAARMLGASPWRAWREVEAPIAGRAILSAAGFAFAISLGEFGATSFLTRPESATLPVAVFRFLSLPGDLQYGQAMASATLLMLLCAIAAWAMEQPGPAQRSA